MLRAVLATMAGAAVIGFAGEPPSAFSRSQGTGSSVISYDDFMKISPDARRPRFASLNPENKALIVRTHAERWLAASRQRLSKSELAEFQEMITFVTPDRYAKRAEAGIDKTEQALREKIRCRVNTADVREAFNVFGAAKPSAEPSWTYLDQAKCWVQWIAEDLIEYVPVVRR